MTQYKRTLASICEKIWFLRTFSFVIRTYCYKSAHSLNFSSSIPRISSSLKTNISFVLSPSLRELPPYSGSNTCYPTDTAIGLTFPSSYVLPGPHATTVPQFAPPSFYWSIIPPFDTFFISGLLIKMRFDNGKNLLNGMLICVDLKNVL